MSETINTIKVDSKRVRKLDSGKFELAYRLPGSKTLTRVEYATEKEARDAAKVMITPKREAKPKATLASITGGGFKLTAEPVAKTDVIKKSTAGRTDNAPRDADQKQVDADVKRNHVKNHAAGLKASDKTKSFDAYTLSQYIVPPKAVDAVLDMLRRATGSGGPVNGTILRYRKGAHASGNIRIQWAILDK